MFSSPLPYLSLLLSFLLVSLHLPDFDIVYSWLIAGAPAPVGVAASNIVITKLKLDKDRVALLERKGKGRQGKSGMSGVD